MLHVKILYGIFESEKIAPLASQSQSVEVTTVTCVYSHPLHKQGYAWPCIHTPLLTHIGGVDIDIVPIRTPFCNFLFLLDSVSWKSFYAIEYK